MRVLLSFVVVLLLAASCGGSTTAEPPVAPVIETEAPAGDYNFDRSDRPGGIENIMTAFATDEATATCIFDAWGDVATVPAEELTPELFNAEVCGTSIFELMTGDSRFTGSDG